MKIDTNYSNNQENYQWETLPPDLPSHIKGLPKEQGFPIIKILIFDGIALKGLLGFLIAQFLYLIKLIRQGQLKLKRVADLGLIEILGRLNQWENLDAFHDFFKPWTFLKKPDVSATWESDSEFGRQRICGINPILIRKCQLEDIRPDGNFPITEALIGQALEEDNLTIESALAGDRLYLLDYKILNDITTPELEDQLGRYSAAPLCLLYSNSKGQLLPIAIRLKQSQETQDLKTNPIFTPASSPQDWLMAKMVVTSADVAYQGIISHLLNTHLIVETFAVSTFRIFSRQHVIFQLLQPHFFNTFAINDMARNIFLGHDGLFDSTGALGFTGSNELLRRAYTGAGERYQGEPFYFYRQSIPVDLAARDVNALPHYYYRDDALSVWEATKSYVSEVLQLAYPSPADLINDAELQAWKDELVHPEKGRVQGLLPPDKESQITGKLESLEDLCEILTTLIFTASAQHSAVNFEQYKYAAWVPNMPFALYRPFSDFLNSHDGQKTQLFEALPNRFQAIKQIILVNTLSMPTPLSSPSLLTMKNPFQEERFRKIFKNFQSVKLKQIEQTIKKRNSSLAQPYTPLLPSKIAQSVAI